MNDKEIDDCLSVIERYLKISWSISYASEVREARLAVEKLRDELHGKLPIRAREGLEEEE